MIVYDSRFQHVELFSIAGKSVLRLDPVLSVQCDSTIRTRTVNLKPRVLVFSLSRNIIKRTLLEMIYLVACGVFDKIQSYFLFFL